jgi:hypothetical protein
MLLTGQSISTGRETCHSATLYTTNITRTGLGSNAGLRGVRPARSPLQTKNRLNYIQSCSSYRAVNALHISPSGALHHSLLYLQHIVRLRAASVDVNIQTCTVGDGTVLLCDRMKEVELTGCGMCEGDERCT